MPGLDHSRAGNLTVRQKDGERHQFWRFVCGVAEHNALIAGALFAIVIPHWIHAGRDFWRLFRNGLVNGNRVCAKRLGMDQRIRSPVSPPRTIAS